MCTHYNFYFNARDRMKQGAQTLADGQEDKYDRVLSIFKYGDLTKAKAVFPDMDEAIKKVSIAITRHSVYAKSKKDGKIAERNAWIDDCYLLIGKCQFYKHDYWTSIETFQYTSSEYKTGSARPEALLWLTKSYLELGKTVDAEYLLDFLKNDKKFPSDLKGEYYAIQAQYHLIKSDIPRAIESLKNASAKANKKDDRARYTFILGQLLQRQGDLKAAFAAYEKVVKYNPVYEMAFNARINRARCYDVNSNSGEVVKRELNRMLKDEKNKEYKDQIYFALAGVARQEKKEPVAIDYLNKSLRTSTSNVSQKAMTYLELADIFLKRPEYIPASAYYDSCLTNLSNDHPDYYNIQAKRNSLDRLVKNLKVITSEDSLQRLAAMSPSEQAAEIDKIISFENSEKERIKKEKEAQQKIEEQKVLEEKELKSQPRNNSAPSQTAQGSWYFYNLSSISFGYSEFLKKWGTRKLEDNWRRSEKEIIQEESPLEAENKEVDSTSKVQKAISDSISKLDGSARKVAYLKEIPSGTQQIAESNARIAEAYYNVGIIYREQLENYPECVNSLETLDKRFPQNKYKQPAYYNLYRTWLTIGDTVKANFYKNYLLTNFPESEYAKLILNPNFFRDVQKKTQVLEVFYENTYQAYLNEQYADVIERKAMAEELFHNNKLTPKFSLLKAMAIGKIKPLADFTFALEDIIREFPKDSVSMRAKDMLDYIKAKSQIIPSDSLKNAEHLKNMPDSTAQFSFSPKGEHFFVVIYKKDELDQNALMAKLNAFNTVNHQADKLKLTNGNIDLAFNYITVFSFADNSTAMSYFTEVMSEEGLLSGIDKNKVNFYVITPENLTTLAKKKNIPAYSEFFQKNYIK